MICVSAQGLALAFAASQFTLGWSHSVTHTRWEETWEAGATGLRPVEAMIQGPGAGMELPDGAWRVEGGWRYKLQVASQREVFLASSGATRSGWDFCAAGQCQEIGAAEGPPIRVWWAESCPDQAG